MSWKFWGLFGALWPPLTNFKVRYRYPNCTGTIENTNLLISRTAPITHKNVLFTRNEFLLCRRQVVMWPPWHQFWIKYYVTVISPRPRLIFPYLEGFTIVFEDLSATLIIILGLGPPASSIRFMCWWICPGSGCGLSYGSPWGRSRRLSGWPSCGLFKWPYGLFGYVASQGVPMTVLFGLLPHYNMNPCPHTFEQHKVLPCSHW